MLQFFSIQMRNTAYTDLQETDRYRNVLCFVQNSNLFLRKLVTSYYLIITIYCHIVPY